MREGGSACARLVNHFNNSTIILPKTILIEVIGPNWISQIYNEYPVHLLMEKHTTKLNYLRGNIEKLHQDIKIKMAEYLEIWHLCKKSYLCRKQHVLIQDWKFYLCFVSSVWAKAEFIVHQMSKHILRNEKSQISKSHQLKSIVSSDGTIIYQNSTKHSYSPMTVFIILTLKIQLSVIIHCRLAQLNMDLQKATCLRTIQNLEFTIPKKTSKAGSVDGQPCIYSSLAERPPWLPLY